MGTARPRREDADDLGVALDLAVEALERFDAVELRPMPGQEAHTGEHVGLGVVPGSGEFRHLRPELAGDGTPLTTRGVGIVLSEGRGHEGRDDPTAILAGVRQCILREVNPAPLPRRRQRLRDRRLDPLVRIGDY